MKKQIIRGTVSKPSAIGLLTRPANIFYGWWIVAISLIIDAVKHGTFQRGFSVYFLPIQKELGISRAAYSLADLFGRLEGAFQGPLVGYLVDRLGSRIMLAAGGVISGLAFILLSSTHSYLHFLLVFVGLAVASRAGYNNASIPAVNQWFRRKRSLAISIVSTGQGVGGAVLTPIVGLMVFNLGWRTSALISGIAIMAVVLPLSLLVKRSPESMGLLPDGLPARAAQSPSHLPADDPDPKVFGESALETPSSPPPGDGDFTTREAMSNPSYWLFVLGVGIRSSVQSGIQWHLVPLMVWGGVSATTAALFIGFMSLSNLIFNPCVGWMGDRWSKQRIYAGATATGALSMVVLMSSGSHLWQLAVFVTLFAISETNNPLNWAILGDFYGRKRFATLYGWLQMPNQLMAMGTPVWVGWVFDRTESYFWALVPFAVMLSFASFIYWTLPKPKIPKRLSQPYGQHSR